MKPRIAAGILACTCLAHAFAAWSQAFPSKPIRVVIPAEPGTLDYYVRLNQPRLQEGLGQPIVIEYRAGGSGVIGALAVAKSAPDGYTLLFTTPGTHVIRPFLTRAMPYDPVADFTPITVYGSSWLSILVHPSIPVSSLAELIEYAKRNPGKLSYGTNGVGTTNHLIGEQLRHLTGIDMTHVPYKGGAPALAAVVSGQLPMVINSVGGATIPSVRSGKVRALAVTGVGRNRQLAEVPNITELLQGFETPPAWIGCMGPAHMPRPVLDRHRRRVS